MAQYNGKVDILFSYDTDIEFESGTIKLTNGVDHMKRKLFKLMQTVPGDWKIYRSVGAKPIEYIGRENTRETGKNLETFLYRQLTEEMYPIDIRVQVVPISRESVKVYIELILLDKIIETIPFTMDFVHGITYTSFDEQVDEVKSDKNLKVDDESLFNPNPIRSRLVKRGL